VTAELNLACRFEKLRGVVASADLVDCEACFGASSPCHTRAMARRNLYALAATHAQSKLPLAW